MQHDHHATIAEALTLREHQVAAVADLLEQGATVPFISRYRKEATGSLDEIAVAAIRDQLELLAELDKRRQSILESLEQRGLLTDELRATIINAPDKARLEDAYLPFRPKRRTRASMARERGLEPLATALLTQRGNDPHMLARHYVNKDKDVPDAEAALAGSRDIIAEMISEDSALRQTMRTFFSKKGRIRSSVVKGKEQAGATFRDWFNWEEPLRTMPGHRALALFRGEREGVLSLSLRPQDHNEREALDLLLRRVVRGKGADAQQVGQAVEDGYKRLLAPSLENECRAELKQRADGEAIAVFANNLRQLLLAPPLGQKNVLALDPGFRTGAKLAVLNAQGVLLHHENIFPTGSAKQQSQAAATLRTLCERYAIEAVAVGNGTAGRETEAFVRAQGLKAVTVLVNEAGASVYSASDVARKEFPDLDITVRGAVSIGRRLMDPLAELVKIDPKAIGVGQYQHDVDQTALKKALDDVVTSCVNSVGVDLNTASAELLAYVSGLGPVLARNIVAHRETSGAFASRAQLLKVKRLGPKAYELAAGFLRVHGANPLDASAVHPERYALVERMSVDAGSDIPALLRDADIRARIDLQRYVDGEVGLPTLEDILAELAKPGRDPRKSFSAFSFAEGITEINDLRIGMRLPGIVTNVTNFGAFVDIGVHRDGLVHISQLSDNYVSDPAAVVAVGQEVLATVIDVDKERGRISLSMKSAPQCASS